MSIRLNFVSSVAFIVFCIALLGRCEAQEQKGCEIRRLEDHLMPFVGHFGYKEHRYPESDDQVASSCKLLGPAKKGARNHTNTCLKGIVKSLTSVIVYASDRLNRLYCKNDKERANYIEMGKCGNRAKKDTTICWNKLTNLATNIIKVQDPKEKIPRLCCSFFDWRDCTLAAYRKVGAPACKETVVENMETFIDRLALDPMKLVCSDFDESDKCDKWMPKLDRSPAKDKYRTPFPPAFEVLMSL